MLLQLLAGAAVLFVIVGFAAYLGARQALEDYAENLEQPADEG